METIHEPYMRVISRTVDESGSHDVPDPMRECGMPSGLDIGMPFMSMPGMSPCASSRPLVATRAAARNTDANFTIVTSGHAEPPYCLTSCPRISPPGLL